MSGVVLTRAPAVATPLDMEIEQVESDIRNTIEALRMAVKSNFYFSDIDWWEPKKDPFTSVNLKDDGKPLAKNDLGDISPKGVMVDYSLRNVQVNVKDVLKLCNMKEYFYLKHHQETPNVRSDADTPRRKCRKPLNRGQPDGINGERRKSLTMAACSPVLSRRQGTPAKRRLPESIEDTIDKDLEEWKLQLVAQLTEYGIYKYATAKVVPSGTSVRESDAIKKELTAHDDHPMGSDLKQQKSDTKEKERLSPNSSRRGNRFNDVNEVPHSKVSKDDKFNESNIQESKEIYLKTSPTEPQPNQSTEIDAKRCSAAVDKSKLLPRFNAVPVVQTVIETEPAKRSAYRRRQRVRRRAARKRPDESVSPFPDTPEAYFPGTNETLRFHEIVDEEYNDIPSSEPSRQVSLEVTENLAASAVYVRCRLCLMDLRSDNLNDLTLAHFQQDHGFEVHDACQATNLSINWLIGVDYIMIDDM